MCEDFKDVHTNIAMYILSNVHGNITCMASVILGGVGLSSDGSGLCD